MGCQQVGHEIKRKYYPNEILKWAKKSAQVLASWKQCLIRTWPIWDINCLQSSTRGNAQMLTLEELERSWTTAFASSWTSTALNCISLQRLRPSLSPQSSVIKLLEQPILLEKPPSHSPCSFLIRPPHPTWPGFPTAAPSVFRHAHLAWGLSHLTCTNLLLPDFLAFKPQCWNSKARKRAYLWTYG